MLAVKQTKGKMERLCEKKSRETHMISFLSKLMEIMDGGCKLLRYGSLRVKCDKSGTLGCKVKKV